MSCISCGRQRLWTRLQYLSCAHARPFIGSPSEVKVHAQARQIYTSLASRERRTKFSKDEAIPFERNPHVERPSHLPAVGQESRSNNLVNRVHREKAKKRRGRQEAKIEERRVSSGSQHARNAQRYGPDSDNRKKQRTVRTRTRRSENSTSDTDNRRPEREAWQTQKEGLQKKFGEAGWAPRKKVSPDAMDGMRRLHAQQPTVYTTPYLAQHFEISPEAVRRILKSKWRPTEEEEEERKQRWEKRGEKIWADLAEDGVKPPKKWRQKGIMSSDRKTRLALRRSDPTARVQAFQDGPTPSLASRIL